MIILDTNVLSELMRPTPHERVAAWSAAVTGSELYITTVTRGEIHYGIERLPEGKRRTDLRERAAALFASLASHTLAFDAASADQFGKLLAERERVGRPISHPDAQIAAIARVHDSTVATRDEGGFSGCGVRVVNPFAEPER